MIDDGNEIDRGEEAGKCRQPSSNQGLPWIVTGRRAGNSRISKIIAQAVTDVEAPTRRNENGPDLSRGRARKWRWSDELRQRRHHQTADGPVYCGARS
jgi:hypothetical protein